MTRTNRTKRRRPPLDGDDPGIDSLNVTSSSLGAMDVAEMDKSVQDAVLPVRSVKVPARTV